MGTKMVGIIDRIQCDYCGKDVSGLNIKELKAHRHVHLQEEIFNKYPKFFAMVSKIEKDLRINIEISFK